MSRKQRIELLIFIACFFAFAYFNQGGGWNQNARFAEVRAMVEEGTFSIDDFLVYQRDPNAQKEDLVRLPLHNAEYDFDGKRNRLCWVDMSWTLYPVGDRPLDPGVEKKAMIEVCSSGDIGYVPWTGHFHPNKPPGTSFLGLPGYFVMYHAEKLLGINPDHWWVIEFNAWMTSVFSVGLVSALGCVLFFRLACMLSGGAELASAIATMVFAFGTTFFPFGTIFFDHNLTASLLLAAFYFIRKGRELVLEAAAEGDSKAKGRCKSDWYFALAGLCAGGAAVTNYIAAVAGFFLGLYALLTVKRWRAAVLFSLGVLPMFVLICWYGIECFGSPFKLSTDFQNPLFKEDGGGAFLGMFPIPHTKDDWWRLHYVATYLTFSPMRGIFVISPVLVMSFYGLFQWMRDRKTRADVLLCIAIFGWFFLVNLFFNGFHGGFSAGPRYLVPGIPFLALPLVVAFGSVAAIRWSTALLAALSIAFNLLLTATDAQNPVGVGGHARVEGNGHGEWSYNLIAEYAWPLFSTGRDWPLLDQLLDLEMQKQQDRINSETSDPAERKHLADELRAELRGTIERGEPSPFMLGSVEGPVSVNPIGVYEGLLNYELFPPGSAPCRWASCNVGEFLWPQSKASLLPLLLISGGLYIGALRLASRKSASVALPENQCAADPAEVSST